MIETPYQMWVKHVVELDEVAMIATVEGSRKQRGSYPISQLKADGGIEEIRRNHAAYLALPPEMCPGCCGPAITAGLGRRGPMCQGCDVESWGC